jgi:hypothetical protein
MGDLRSGRSGGVGRPAPSARALPRPELTEAKALELLRYHLRRNRRARDSHYKTWRKKHPQIQFKVLL